MLDAQARETDLHQVRRALGDDNFSVRCDMVAVRMRNERETFCVPRIQPEIVLRQVNAAVVANCNHAKNYFGIGASSMVPVKANAKQTCALTSAWTDRFITEMRFAAAVFILSVLTLSALGKGAREEPKVVEKVTPLPVALDKNFEFRKTKLFFLSEQAPKASERARGTSTLGAKSNTPNQ